jgi:competence protein ComEA
MNCANFAKLVSVPLSCVIILSTAVATRGQTAPPKTASKAKAAAKVVLDLNKATAEEMEADLPGVGPATAKKIVSGRPYSSVDDLTKAGVSKRVIESIRPHVTLGAAIEARSNTAKSKTAGSKAVESKVELAKETTKGKVNLNTAELAALEDLPGIGPATAKAIMEGRPWKSVDELDKIRGLGKNRIAALRDLVTFGDEPAPAAAKKASSVTTAAKSSATKAMPKTPTQPGHKVDINTAAKEELDALPGIGPVKAQAIIEGRPFKTIEDIKNVKGIKDGEFSKIQDLITVK